MRKLRLLSTTMAILLWSAGAVLAQGIKTDPTPGAPAVQPASSALPNAPAEKMALPLKSGPGTTRAAAPTAPKSVVKGSTGVADSANVKHKRTARHVRARYAGGHHLYNSYRRHRGFGRCRGSWMPMCW
jgi:hypothetical protein